MYNNLILTFSPIETLSKDEMSSLQNGNKITKTVTGLEVFSFKETLSVKLRKCGEDYHVLLKPSPMPFSAYCVGKKMILSSNRNGSCFEKNPKIKKNH